MKMPKIHNREKIFSTNGAEKTISTCRIMKLDLYLLTQKSTTNGQRSQYETQNTETE